MSDKLKNFPVITMPNGKKYHESAEEFQRNFHKCTSKYRWLGGGVGGGKSAASTVEVLRHSWQYPNNYGFILRKTFPELRLSAIKDFYEICPAWMIVEDNRQEHWVDVYNYVGYLYRKKNFAAYKAGKITKRDYIKGLKAEKGTSRVEFISFEGTEAAEQKFRSANIGWYMMEQAEEGSTIIYDRLNERLRRVPSGRQAWFISNPDGRDWLWDIFHPDSEGYRPNHTMFEVELTNNSNLPDDFHESLKNTYSDDDYKRLVEGSFDVATDAVFPEFSFDVHVIPHFDPPDDWDKCLSLDHGLNNPTGAVNMTRFPTGEAYIYEEYYVSNKLVSEHASILRNEMVTPSHKLFTIDPTCVNRSPISGATVIGEYNRAGIPFQPGVKDVMVGINRIKEYLKFDLNHPHPISKQKGAPRVFISDRCHTLIRQLQRYKKETLKTNRGAQNSPEKMRKYYDHLVDALRWGMVGFMPSLSGKSHVPENKGKKKSWDRLIPAKSYEFINKEGNFSIGSLIKQADKPPQRRRPTSWNKE